MGRSPVFVCQKRVAESLLFALVVCLTRTSLLVPQWALLIYQYSGSAVPRWVGNPKREAASMLAPFYKIGERMSDEIRYTLQMSIFP